MQKSMYFIILTKRKKYINHFNSQRKSICQNPTSFSNKNFQKTNNRSQLPQPDKGNLKNLHLSSYKSVWKSEWSPTKQECPLSPPLFNMVLQLLANKMRKISKRRLKLDNTITISLFIDNMIIYVEKLLESIKKPLAPKNEFRKLQDTL